MWNPFSRNTTDVPSEKPAEQGADERQERKFRHRGSGAFWHVFDYTDRKTGKVRDNLVAKRLK